MLVLLEKGRGKLELVQLVTSENMHNQT